MNEDGLRSFYADLHIHIGRTDAGQPVKISGSRDLTFFNIAKEASERKGIEIIGIIDCHSPGVIADIDKYLASGEMEELDGGGIRYRGTTVLLGCELEVRDPGTGPAHLLAYLPSLAAMREFSVWLSRHMKNINLSSQRIYVTARTVQDKVIDLGGFLIPAHIFTPHKSLYGSAVDRLSELLDPERVAAVELGLSSDTPMADHISELSSYTFVTDSDAHSLAKIGREYNQMRLAAPTFEEVRLALLRRQGRRIEANFGLSPRLGKYHRTYCTNCLTLIEGDRAILTACPACGSPKLVSGVMDRIMELADRTESVSPSHRPPYYEQVPLEFIPGLGRKTLDKLLAYFGTEMNILHRVAEEELARVAGSELASLIAGSREGKLTLKTGGGGTYGKISRPEKA